MLKNTEAIICFILFPTNFPIVPMAALCYSRPIFIKLNSKLRTDKKHRSYNLFHVIFLPSFIWQLYDIVVRSFLWQLYDIVVRVDKI